MDPLGTALQPNTMALPRSATRSDDCAVTGDVSTAGSDFNNFALKWDTEHDRVIPLSSKACGSTRVYVGILLSMVLVIMATVGGLIWVLKGSGSIVPTAPPTAAPAHKDTEDAVLAQICKHYYIGGTYACNRFVSTLRVNNSRSLPTIELGNRAASVTLLFVHSWPDSAALWARQMEQFCSDPHGAYYCVAPTLTDFHPDRADAPASSLHFDAEVRRLHALVAEDLGGRKVTIVAQGVGAALGYMLAHWKPAIVERLITLDMGNWHAAPTAANRSSPAYTKANTQVLSLLGAYASKNDATSARVASDRGAPCASCAVAREGWVFVELRSGTWRERMDTNLDEITPSLWKRNFTSSSLAQKVLFFYATRSPQPRSMRYFSSEWIAGLKRAGGTVKPVNSSSWISMSTDQDVYAAMQAFLLSAGQ